MIENLWSDRKIDFWRPINRSWLKIDFWLESLHLPPTRWTNMTEWAQIRPNVFVHICCTVHTWRMHTFVKRMRGFIMCQHFLRLPFHLNNTSATWLRVFFCFTGYRVGNFTRNIFCLKSFSLGLIELEVSEKNWIWGARTCHNSASRSTEGWEISEVVS